MKTRVYRLFLFLLMVFTVSTTWADSSDTHTKQNTEITQSAKDKKPEPDTKKYEPAGKFTPTEKLRADETVAFPVDI